MDKSKSGEGEVKREPRKKMTIKLSSRERSFIIISDFIIVGFITLDLIAFVELISIPLGPLTMANLVMVAFTYFYLRFKRRITIRALREAEKSK